jgi:hypothetical protein
MFLKPHFWNPDSNIMFIGSGLNLIFVLKSFLTLTVLLGKSGNEKKFQTNLWYEILPLDSVWKLWTLFLLLFFFLFILYLIQAKQLMLSISSWLSYSMKYTNYFDLFLLTMHPQETQVTLFLSSNNFFPSVFHFSHAWLNSIFLDVRVTICGQL